MQPFEFYCAALKGIHKTDILTEVRQSKRMG